MIGKLMIIIFDVFLCGVVVVGNSLFLKFSHKRQNVTLRFLNVLLILLSTLNLVSSLALVIEHVLYLFVWDSIIPSTLDGQIDGHIFMFLINSKNIIFLMIALASFVKTYNKTLYLQASLKAKWTVILIVILLTLILLHVHIFTGECLESNAFAKCGKDHGTVMVISTVVFTFLIQLWVVVDCCYRRRKIFKKWIVNKWNRYNNNVVEFSPEQEGDEPVQIYVVQLQNWNQVSIIFFYFPLTISIVGQSGGQGDGGHHDHGSHLPGHLGRLHPPCRGQHPGDSHHKRAHQPGGHGCHHHHLEHQQHRPVDIHKSLHDPRGINSDLYLSSYVMVVVFLDICDIHVIFVPFYIESSIQYCVSSSEPNLLIPLLLVSVIGNFSSEDNLYWDE